MESVWDHCFILPNGNKTSHSYEASPPIQVTVRIFFFWGAGEGLYRVFFLKQSADIMIATSLLAMWPQNLMFCFCFYCIGTYICKDFQFIARDVIWCVRLMHDSIDKTCAINIWGFQIKNKFIQKCDFFNIAKLT